jgi:hypothetical protein
MQSLLEIYQFSAACTREIGFPGFPDCLWKSQCLP